LRTFSLPRLTLLAFVLLVTAGTMACEEASPNLGRYHRGRTLDVAVMSMEWVPELRYSTIQQTVTPPPDSPCATAMPAPDPAKAGDPEGKIRHWRISPTDKDLQLVLVHLKVENHTASSAIVNADEQAAELRDFASTVYRPLNISKLVQETTEAPGPLGRSLVFVQGAFELKRDCGVDGWMVFEAPKDTKFKEFRWRASDSLTIEF